MAACIASTPDGSREMCGDRPRRRVRDRVRPGRRRSTSAIGRARFCASTRRTARRCSRRCRRASRRSIWRSGPTVRSYVSAPTLVVARSASIACRRDGVVETFERRVRPAAGPRVRRRGRLYVVDALAGASALYRLRPGRPETGAGARRAARCSAWRSIPAAASWSARAKRSIASTSACAVCCHCRISLLSAIASHVSDADP